MSAVTFPERLPPNVILMGVIQPARRPRKHLAAVSLTIVTLAVLALEPAHVSVWLSER